MLSDNSNYTTSSSRSSDAALAIVNHGSGVSHSDDGDLSDLCLGNLALTSPTRYRHSSPFQEAGDERARFSIAHIYRFARLPSTSPRQDPDLVCVKTPARFPMMLRRLGRAAFSENPDKNSAIRFACVDGLLSPDYQ